MCSPNHSVLITCENNFGIVHKFTKYLLEGTLFSDQELSFKYFPEKCPWSYNDMNWLTVRGIFHMVSCHTLCI